MSGIGPSRHFDAAKQLGCFRSEADIDLGGSRDRSYGNTPSSISGRLSLGGMFAFCLFLRLVV
jgi:hypothetical protein